MKAILSTAIVALALPSVLALGGGCSTADAEERIELGAADLPASAGEQPNGVWQSVGWAADPWQRYSGRVTLRIEHGLGRIPTSIVTYISFDSAGRSAGVAAGDLARVVEVTENHLTIENGTNSDLYCRIVAQ